jgi:hypothetical protein
MLLSLFRFDNINVFQRERRPLNIIHPNVKQIDQNNAGLFIKQLLL